MNNDIDLVCERLDRLEMTLRSLVTPVTGAVAPHGADLTADQTPNPGIAEKSVHKSPHVKEVTTLPVAQPRSYAGPSAKDATLAAVEASIAARKCRLKYFDTDFFFDPVWAIMIDLYRAELKGERLSVSSACYGSGVAQTTALRYVAMLEDRGYVERVPDENDKRRAFLRLTGSARDRLENYFGHLGTHRQPDYRLVA